MKSRPNLFSANLSAPAIALSRLSAVPNSCPRLNTLCGAYQGCSNQWYEREKIVESPFEGRTSIYPLSESEHISLRDLDITVSMLTQNFQYVAAFTACNLMIAGQVLKYVMRSLTQAFVEIFAITTFCCIPKLNGSASSIYVTLYCSSLRA